MRQPDTQRQTRYRIKRQAIWESLPKISCGCGCGALLTPFTAEGKPRRFALGHNARREAIGRRFRAGQEPWNKGSVNGYTTASKGCRRSRESIQQMVTTRRERGNYTAWNKGRPHPHTQANASSSGVGAFRPDLGRYFRSRWEANYARYLKATKHAFVYEPERLILQMPDGSGYAYLPDFLVDGRHYVEVKGWERADRWPLNTILGAARAQLSRPLIALRRSQYLQLERTHGHQIPHWEFRGDPGPAKPAHVCPACHALMTKKPIHQKYCSRKCQPHPFAGHTLSPEAVAKRTATRVARYGTYWPKKAGE